MLAVFQNGSQRVWLSKRDTYNATSPEQAQMSHDSEPRVRVLNFVGVQTLGGD